MKKWGKFSKKRFRGDFLGGVLYRGTCVGGILGNKRKDRGKKKFQGARNFGGELLGEMPKKGGKLFGKMSKNKFRGEILRGSTKGRAMR